MVIKNGAAKMNAYTWAIGRTENAKIAEAAVTTAAAVRKATQPGLCGPKRANFLVAQKQERGRKGKLSRTLKNRIWNAA